MVLQILSTEYEYITTVALVETRTEIRIFFLNIKKYSNITKQLF